MSSIALNLQTVKKAFSKAKVEIESVFSLLVLLLSYVKHPFKVESEIVARALSGLVGVVVLPG